jgi:hypothetical protein
MRIRSDVLEWRDVEGEIVALDLRTQTYLAINKTGAAIWPMLLAGRDRSELRAELTRKFGVSEEQADEDLDAFLAELAEQNLLEPTQY